MSYNLRNDYSKRDRWHRVEEMGLGPRLFFLKHILSIWLWNNEKVLNNHKIKLNFKINLPKLEIKQNKETYLPCSGITSQRRAI